MRFPFNAPALNRAIALATSIITLVGVPSAIIAMPAAARAGAAQTAADVVIDGPPTTVDLAPEGAEELTFEWDVSSRIRMSYEVCSNIRFSIFDPDSILAYDFGCNFTEDPHSRWRDSFPTDINSQGDPGTYTIRFITMDNDGGSHPATMTFRLQSLSASTADPITPGGDAGALPALGEWGAVWLSFNGTQGDDIALQTSGESCYWRYRVRRPDKHILVDKHRVAIAGCDAGGQGLVELGSLPMTGSYRIELVAPVTGIGPGTARLIFRSAPEACHGHDVAPILLVHGFNGNAADWDAYRPTLVDNLAHEFQRAGVDQSDAAICADLFIQTASLPPRANSHRNGALVAALAHALLERTGAAGLDVIAHSKGGLDTRRAIDLMGEEGSVVRNVMMLATPNRGTLLADIACALHHLRPVEAPVWLIASAIVEANFGPCRDQDDALYVITEDYVEETFNRLVIDRPGTVYQVLAGDSTCLICRLVTVLIGDNDMFVPVRSVVGPSGRYPLLGTFDRNHDQLLQTDAVIQRAYCGLVGRRPDPATCATASSPAAPDLAAHTPSGSTEAADSGGVAHVDAVQIAGGDSASVVLPIGGLGTVGIAVMSSNDAVSARIGSSQLTAEQTEFGHTLTTEITSAFDVNLTISNPGPEPADAMILVFGTDPEELTIESSPEVGTPGEPVEVRVPGVGSVAGLDGVISDPDGTETVLAFSGEGDDAVASFTPTSAGDHLVSVVHAGTQRRIALRHFVTRIEAASLPGSFTESVETGSDGAAAALNLDVDIDVAEAASYRLTGILATVDGTEVASTETATSLTAGVQQVRLTIPGPTLYAAGEDGPYDVALTLVRVDPATGEETIAAQVSVGSPTQPYLAADFQPAVVRPGYATLHQGDFDTVVAEVPVTLSEPVTRPVTVEYGSLNPPGDEFAHFPDDFQAVSGTLTFLPGETAKTIPITINGNPAQQGNKLAVIGFTNPANATLGGSGQGGVAILAEPTATVDAPAAGLTWSTGEQVSFSGQVDDPVDGLLPASALHWQLRLQHCPAPPDPAGCHTHQLQEWHGVAGGSFTTPDHGYPAHLELELTAEGPSGLTHQMVRELHPETVQITVASNPPGRLVAGGFPPALFQQRTPYTLTAIQGSTVLLGALDHQENGTNYVFQQWSHGGPATQAVQAPTVATTYTATYVTDLVTINPPSTGAGHYNAVAAAFGPPPTASSPARSVVLVNDGSARPTEGCNPLVGFPTGAIAVVDRGTCPFTQKVRNAQTAGAVAVMVINNQPGVPIRMDGTDPTITIPSVMVSSTHGTTIKAGLPATGTVTRVIPAGS